VAAHYGAELGPSCVVIVLYAATSCNRPCCDRHPSAHAALGSAVPIRAAAAWNMLLQRRTCCCSVEHAVAACKMLLQRARCCCSVEHAVAACNMLLQRARCCVQHAVAACNMLLQHGALLVAVRRCATKLSYDGFTKVADRLQWPAPVAGTGPAGMVIAYRHNTRHAPTRA
jgi:hypothetical protein